MSIEGNYTRISPQEFSRLKKNRKAPTASSVPPLKLLEKNPEAVFEWLRERRSGEHSSFTIGTDWHAMHFLLTGDAQLGEKGSRPAPPLGNVVQGGSETQWDCTYGKVRLLEPDEVKEVASALARISAKELSSRFSVDSFNANDIYPHGRQKRWTEQAAETVFSNYPRLVKFFELAAKNGEVVLLSSD